MKNKLTLRLDDSLIKQAKKRAKEQGTSVSQMVADYFSLIEKGTPSFEEELPPITSSLSGILNDTDLREEDYKQYLVEKHLQ